MSDDNLNDPVAETLEDVISGEFCECGHLLKSHFVGIITGSTKCYSMSFNGAVWSNCSCKKMVVMEFTITGMIPDANISESKTT